MKVLTHYHSIRSLAVCGAVVLLALAPVGTPVQAQEVDRAQMDATTDAVKGGKLKPEQVAALETRVKTNPEDTGARNQLLGYYFSTKHKSAENREAGQQHFLWLVEHQPEAGILDSGFVGLNRSQDGSVYEQCKELWLKQVKASPNAPKILNHAAKYFLLEEKSIAEALLKQGQELEPHNPDWSSHLAQLYHLDANPKKTGAAEAAKKALAQLERAQADTTNAIFRTSNLAKLAKFAFDAGAMDKARTYATESLAAAKSMGGDGGYTGNLVLGRIALRAGNAAAAREHLLASGRAEGPYVKTHSSPNLSLANDLLAHGDRATVLEFFKLCENLWLGGAPKLERWSKEIEAGLAPDFGANLVY